MLKDIIRKILKEEIERDLINLNDVLLIHNELIDRYGGIPGVRDRAQLNYVIDKPNMTAFGEELFPDLFSKLGAFIESMVLTHPFDDGNKRTAFHVVKNILTEKGYSLTLGYDQARPYLAKIVTNRIEPSEIGAWLSSKV